MREYGRGRGNCSWAYLAKQQKMRRWRDEVTHLHQFMIWRKEVIASQNSWVMPKISFEWFHQSGQKFPVRCFELRNKVFWSLPCLRNFIYFDIVGYVFEFKWSSFFIGSGGSIGCNLNLEIHVLHIRWSTKKSRVINCKPLWFEQEDLVQTSQWTILARTKTLGEKGFGVLR